MYPLILYLSAVVPPASDSPGRLKGGNPWPQILTESPDCSGSWHLSLALGSWHQAEYVLPGGEGGVLAQLREHSGLMAAGKTFWSLQKAFQRYQIRIIN